MLTDLRMLGNIKKLHLKNLANVVFYPLPMRNDQEWNIENCSISDLTGYNKLYSLTLKSCQNVSDISPLHDIHTLKISDCKNISNIRR